MKSTIVTTTLVLFLTTPSPVLAQAEVTKPDPGMGYSWNLVWNDEFEGNKIDETKWRILGDEVRRDGWWLKEDAYVNEGNLILRTKFDPEKGRYGSGALDSSGKFEHRYGYYEARIKFAKKNGHWGAFWLHTWNVSTIGNDGRDGTEIDIVEKPWTNDHVQQTLHWDGYGTDHKYESNSIDWAGISDGYHIVGLDWRPDEYVFYIDGKESWRTRGGGVSQVPEFIYLTDEVGSWIGNINSNELPDYMYVDYVRVYDLVESTPLPGDLDGNGRVDIFDYNLLVAAFGHPYTIFDYNQLVANFGKGL